MKNEITVKEAFESDNIIIIKITQGERNNVRIDAKRRFRIADKPMFMSKWVSREYAQRLASENYGKQLSDFSTYEY